jgi:hypothetical protein
MSDPVLPLYLNQRETQVLRIAVEILLQMDGAVINDPELQRMAEQQIRDREGVAGVARADQALMEARERVPVLERLHAALIEHGETLQRVRRRD